MRQFRVPLSDMYIGEFITRQNKNDKGEVVGQQEYVKLEYRGGYLVLEIDKVFAETLKVDMHGTAMMQMTPSMEGKNIQNKAGREFTIIETGFDKFKLVGFEPESTSKFTAGK